jgi:hypothetical protein
MCYDTNSGYVYNHTTTPPQWQQPPTGTAQCGQYYYWPKIRTCYDSVSGYYFNPTTKQWVYIGTNFTVDAGDDGGGCAITEAPQSGSGTLWALFGLTTGVGIVARRRRRSLAGAAAQRRG